MSIRTRVAPEPPPARLQRERPATALSDNLFASAHHGGTFVLRIEDRTAKRSDRGSTRAIIEGLRWLGLNWDEARNTSASAGPLPVRAQRRCSQPGAVYRCGHAEEIEARGGRARRGPSSRLRPAT